VCYLLWTMPVELATRRGFLGSLCTLAGGVAAAAASACGGVGDERSPGDPAGIGPSYTPQWTVAPVEIVAVAPGVTYDNVLPTHVPFVRWPRPGATRAQAAAPGHKL
jgi:hypothetical protein